MFCDAMFENVMILYESNLDDCYQYPDPPELFFSGSAQVNDIRKAMSEVEFSGSPRVETAGLDCEITSQLAPFGCLAAVYLEGPTPISFGAYAGYRSRYQNFYGRRFEPFDHNGIRAKFDDWENTRLMVADTEMSRAFPDALLRCPGAPFIQTLWAQINGDALGGTILCHGIPALLNDVDRLVPMLNESWSKFAQYIWSDKWEFWNEADSET